MQEDHSSPTACSSELFAPTACLPSINHIQTTPLAKLRSSVEYLRFLYNPEVRGSRRRKTTVASVPRGSSNDNEERSETERLTALRADAFERSHAIRWLTSLVAHGDELLTYTSDADIHEANEDDVREGLIEDAASLLAACAGTASSGHISRRYAFGPSPQGEQVSIALTDAPLENANYATVGAQTWGGACVLADMVLESPERFRLPLIRTPEEGAFRILELGAGTGLVGLTIAKLLEIRGIQADVVLTDFHPSVLDNLRSNLVTNFPAGVQRCINISIEPLDWSSYASGDGSVGLGTFDLIVGADIIYESSHALWIKKCFESLLRPDAYFHLVIPLRRTHVAESSTVEQVFGQGGNSEFRIFLHEPFSCDSYVDDVPRRRMADRTDEVEYAYFEIGWERRL